MNQETRPTADTKACPVCGETIKAVAVKCRFCNTDLTAYAASKEAQIERDLFVGHPAVIYNVGQIAPFLIPLIGIAIAVAAKKDLPIIFIALVALAGLLCLHFYLKSKRIHYRITTQRIKLERGLLSKVEESLELFRIDHFGVPQASGDAPRRPSLSASLLVGRRADAVRHLWSPETTCSLGYPPRLPATRT